MLYQIVFITALSICNTNSHSAKNSSDIIIVGGHADLHDDTVVYITTTASSKKLTTPSSDSEDEFMKNEESKTGLKEEGGKEDVVFVPAERHDFKNDGTMHEDTLRMSDLLDGKRITAIKETEKPPGDVLFIQGRNSERDERPSSNGRKYNNEDRNGEFKYIDDDEDTVTTTPLPLDCDNLDCDNSLIASICGRKVERSETKLRLFKNECFLRKVNCGLSVSNRYQQVEEELCKTVGMHVTNQPYEPPLYLPPSNRQGRHEAQTRHLPKGLPGRNFGGRRAMAMDVGGSYCAHACPIICTKDYDPECALSATGERRVFLNHCELDLNSCQYDMLWRRRPLAECTGGKMADLHQNRAFIDWMQRAGIVDKKGKLVLNK